MLRTYILTSTALYTVGSLSALHCMDHIVPVSAAAQLGLRNIIVSKQVGNKNVLGTSVNAVTACCTWNCFIGLQNLADLIHRCHFALIKRLKVLHVLYVVLHLSHIAHTGEYHHDIVKACGIADSIACAAVAVAKSEGKLDEKIFNA